jgi:hypothetical protein
VSVQDETRDVPPVLRFDAIRIATLITLGVLVLVQIGLVLYLNGYVRGEQARGACYQRQIDALTSWAETAVEAGRSDRQAQRELLLSSDAGIDRPESLQRYLARLDEADRTRSTAPVPAQVCAR